MLKGIDRAEIESARSGATDIWSAGNATLYRLCAEFPVHTDAEEVIGKLWLIGRAYTAAIERRPTSREKQKLPMEEYYRRAAGALANSGLDEQLALLRDRRPKAARDLAPALRAHAAVVAALHGLSSIHQRSFASKYLHFHAPDWFFILDSIASRALRRLRVRVQNDPRLLDTGGDQAYRAFVEQAWALRDQLARTAAPALTPRQLDRFLLKRGM